MDERKDRIKSFHWMLAIYDVVVFAAIAFVLLYLHPSESTRLENIVIWHWVGVGVLCMLFSRIITGVYRSIWRYANSSLYLLFMVSGLLTGALFTAADFIFKATGAVPAIRFILVICIVSLDIFVAIGMRMSYVYFFQKCKERSFKGTIARLALRIFSFKNISPESSEAEEKEKKNLRIAIVGAGRAGMALAEDLLNNPASGYTPICFIEKDPAKVGRNLSGIPIRYENSTDIGEMRRMKIDMIVLAVPDAGPERKRDLVNFYKQYGIDVLTYDYALGSATDNSRPTIREFTIEELLARKPIELKDERVKNYYRDKVVMVTGGGGSIGSELANQLAAMKVKQLIILDIAENSTYDIRNDLIKKYGKSLNLAIEICTVCDYGLLEKVFAKYRPQIVLHAAAHKHVPLMEHNSVECVKNNVYGTRNTMELAMKYKVEHFIMVSTDKAVNPTNVMGSTKRICELMMHVFAHSEGNETVFSATRFGNVLGSAGSVVPLFKKQIKEGGPVTLTDKRVIRYFMTIPEASQLVLTSGAMAKNGELFVLDMGKPVKILDLALNMIKLMGRENDNIEIIEEGLRPGEKLFEELLIEGREVGRTENELIFIEKDEPLEEDELKRRLALLAEKVDAYDEAGIKAIMPQVVPTYIVPANNSEAEEDNSEPEEEDETEGSEAEAEGETEGPEAEDEPEESAK